MLKEKQQIDERLSWRSVEVIEPVEEDEGQVGRAPTSTSTSAVAQRTLSASMPEGSTASLDDDSGLAIPVALQIRSLSAQSATLVWDGGEEGGTYNLYLCEDRRTHWSNCDSFDLDSNRAVLEGLAPDSRYRLDIVSIDGEGRHSETSDVLYLETLAPGADRIDIPAFAADDSLAVNNACYNDCANTYAIVVNQGGDFDLAACSKRCRL